MHPIEFITGPEMDEELKQKKSKRCERIVDGRLPRPVKYGKRSLWPKHEIEAIKHAILTGATDHELRALVAQLHAERKQVAVSIEVSA